MSGRRARRGDAAPAILVALTGAVLLSGCAEREDPTPLTGPTWHISDVFTEPGVPAELPPAAAGAAVMVLGEHTVTGNTGCAPFQAEVHYYAQGGETTSDRAETLRFTHLRVDDPHCEGPAEFFHAHLTDLLHEELSVTMLNPREVILRSTSVDYDAPAIRLISV